jgi:hypothetical protein
MTRPLMQSRIGDLEDLFASSRSKLDVLRQLEHELQFRQVPRAQALLEQVQRAQASGRPAIAGAANPGTTKPGNDVSTARPTAAKTGGQPVTASGQLSLLLTTPTLAQPAQVSGGTNDPPVHVPAPPPPKPVSPQPEAQAPVPSVSIEDAHKLLKVAPGAPWELVELARRKAVQPSSPQSKGVQADQRAKLLAAARLANAAYAVIASARISHQ